MIGRRRRQLLRDVGVGLFIGLMALTVANCQAARPSGDPQVLLFNGTGTSPNDVTAIERLLSDHRLPYDTASSFRMNRMSAADLTAYRLLIVPGGNFVDMGHGLAPNAVASLRAAIGSGLNYLGLCAGAFIAGNSPYNGLNLTSGVRFPFYGIEGQGVRKAAVPIASPGAPTLEQYWEDGPQLSGWGEVIAKYPDGTPAVVQGAFGDGWIVLSGVHPEAPENWRRGLTFTTPTSVDHAYAITLIDAALTRKRLAHY